jgi:DNA-binding transcriptional MerR regulator
MGGFTLRIGMLKIGDFARMGRVSVKALRHYDAIGLLRPMHIDRATGYRYYSAAQLPVLNRLLIFKNLGFSLQQTRSFLDESCSAARLRALLQARQTELSHRIELETAQLGEVMKRIRQIECEDARALYEVVIRETVPCEVLSVRRPLPDYGALEPLLDLLRSGVPRAEIRAHGAIWHRCGSSGDTIDCEALVLLKHPRAGSHALGGAKVASVTYQDSDADPFPRLYRAVLETVDAGDYEIQWPMREIYHAEDLSVTEVQFPVRKMNGDHSYAV